MNIIGIVRQVAGEYGGTGKTINDAGFATDILSRLRSFD